MSSAATEGRAARRVRALTTSLVVLLLAICVLLAGATWALLFRSQHDVAPGREVMVDVAEGESTAAIARKLVEAGVIDNEYMFRLRARLSGSDAALAPGSYELTTGMPHDVLVKRLKAGAPAAYVTVTIPEGFVIDQIAERLRRDAGVPVKETLALARGGAAEFAEDHPYLATAHDGSLEGFLFPKTYRLRKGVTAREALETMLDQFDREIARVDLTAATARGLSMTQLVVIASIIEREAQVEGERPLVSSVIANRLTRGMLLEIDATVEYVLPGNRFRLRYKDLRVDSPYNTYRVKGLPPGPIASPGLASLEAAAAPADTEYLYYVLTGRDGSHTFATNKRDFLVAKQRSKEVFGR